MKKNYLLLVAGVVSVGSIAAAFCMAVDEIPKWEWFIVVAIVALTSISSNARNDHSGKDE